MNNTTTQLDDLEAQKGDLINEKQSRAVRIAEINAALKTRQPKPVFIELIEERAQLVAANAAADSEIRDLNEELKVINRAVQKGCEKKDKPLASLGLVVALVAGYRAAGDTRSTQTLAGQAIAEMAELRSILETLS